MAIERLAQPCWVLDPEGGPGGKITVACRPEPCWIVTCDGDCGEQPEDDEYGSNIHCASLAEAEQFATSCDWIVTRDGGVFCPDDAPDCSMADLAVIEQIPGQLMLDGREVPDG